MSQKYLQIYNKKCQLSRYRKNNAFLFKTAPTFQNLPKEKLHLQTNKKVIHRLENESLHQAQVKAACLLKIKLIIYQEMLVQTN